MHRGVQELREFVKRANGRLLVLTGAGVSTDSGVPDYRGPTGIYKRNKDYKPITYQQFMSSEAFRKRYWGRSFLGWPKLQSAEPNSTHLYLTELEKRGLTRPLMTQNVDGLHSKSGSSHVLELHGTLSQVQCQNCGFSQSRQDFQLLLGKLNPELEEWGRLQREQINERGPDVASSVNPDGDFELKQASIINNVSIPPCSSCGGVLKPDVVFFGENLKIQVREESFDRIDLASALLVVGSSLQVFSAYRIVKKAHERQIPIAILNVGETRADGLATLRIDEKSSPFLESLVESM